MTDYSKIKVKLEDSTILDFYFAYNKNTTSLDELLEFMAYHFPNKNICPCCEFKASYEKKQMMVLEKNWHFYDCISKYTDFELFIPNKECKCDNIIRDNFKKKKLEIIQNLTRSLEINNNKSNIKINEKNGQIEGNNNFILLNKDAKFNEFYDIIVDIKSIKDICKGWEIKMSKKAEEDYEKLKSQKVIRIGVIGNANKGKSFLLSKISQMDLPVGTNIRTEGLSIKYPENLDKYENRRIVLLDSAGLETPVLNDNGEDEKDVFKEKSREKLITELFLQNYIVKNSDILLIVVGIMTYSEQKLLNKIKLQLKNSKYNKNIFVIHNLMTFTRMEQVKEYIDNVLLKSVTFKLEEGHKINISTEKVNGLYYIERDEEKSYDFKIYHYIMANEGSEAGNYCNEFVKNQLHKFFIVAKDEPFDVINTIKERFIDMSKEMLEKIDEPIKMENFDNTNDKIIKLNKPNNLILKKCLIDELGFSILRTNGFMPVYNYYKKDDLIIVRVEAPGNCNLKSSIINSGEYTIIRLEGKKNKDKEPNELKDNLYYNREFGDFSLDIGLKSSEFLFKNEVPKIDEKKGVFIIQYKLDEKKNVAEFTQKEEEEI